MPKVSSRAVVFTFKSDYICCYRHSFLFYSSNHQIHAFMRASPTYLFLLFLLASTSLFPQQAKDKAVPLTATVQTNPLQVVLNWTLLTPTADLVLARREKDAVDWFVLVNATASSLVSFTDTQVEVSKTYEYALRRVANSVIANGYLTVPIEAPLVDDRGKLLVLVEEALQIPLAAEFDRLERDLAGDGWQVVWLPVMPSDGVPAVKAQIVAGYEADPERVRAVLLFGDIPVPYSGNTAWDGHGDHQGAWPADNYYGDVNFEWADAAVNNTTPARPENDNVPNDGKFDHSISPTTTELAVGRVDFSNLSEMTFGTTRVELYRRYLDKNHRWRTKQYTVASKALVDDNFGYFGGEAFGANGWRNGYPLVGVNNVMEGDFFNETDGEGFLLGYGCGGGTYTSAGGVGNSTNFATDSVNVVFSMLFGSYHGDWDYSPNPFMPSALASKGGILSCSWAGRPHWFYHHLAAGETLGYCALASQNACDIDGYSVLFTPQFGFCGAHVALLGDPTLRAHVIAPASELAMVNKCTWVELSWKASEDPEVEGYHVYRSTNQGGAYVRLTNDPLATTKFIDDAPLNDTMFYQVRAVKPEKTLAGSYYNSSTGTFSTTVFQTGTPPVVIATGDTLTCSDPQATISAETDAQMPAFDWGTAGAGQSIVVNASGTYTVTVTDGETGCTATATAVVELDDSFPVASPIAGGILTCAVTEVTLFANPANSGLTFAWTGPGSFNSDLENPVVNEPGLYTLVVTDPANGCSVTYSVAVAEDVQVPVISVIPTIKLTCDNPQITLNFNSICDGVNTVCFLTTPDGNTFPVSDSYTIDLAGEYTLEVAYIATGCSSKVDIQVEEDLVVPDLTVNGNLTVLCSNSTTTLTASSSVPGVIYSWTNSPNPSSPVQQLPPGIYTVTAIAPNGCFTMKTVTVTSPPEIFAEISVISVDCQGFVTPSIVVSGGMPPYTVVFTPVPPIPPNSQFTVIITDANGCMQSVDLTTPPYDPLTTILLHTDETTAGANDGTATAVVSNGQLPLTYLWSNGANTPSITNLAPGVYSVTVTGSDGCTATGSVEVLPGMTGTADVPGLQQFKLFPNPTTGQFEVALILEKPASVRVEIQDLTGRTLVAWDGETMAFANWRFDVSSHPAGVYVCKIMVNGQSLSRRLVKIQP
jgi:hypothetical protein